MFGSSTCIFCGTQNGRKDRYCRLCRSPLGEGGSWKPPDGVTLPGTPSRGLPALLIAIALVAVLAGGTVAARGMIDAARSDPATTPAAAAPASHGSAATHRVAEATPTPAPSSKAMHPARTPGVGSNSTACGTSPNVRGKAGQRGAAGENGKAGDHGKAGENGNQSNPGQGLEIGQECGSP